MKYKRELAIAMLQLREEVVTKVDGQATRRIQEVGEEEAVPAESNRIDKLNKAGFKWSRMSKKEGITGRAFVAQKRFKEANGHCHAEFDSWGRATKKRVYTITGHKGNHLN